MAENLNKNLSVDVLAKRAAMSPRNFSRVFRKETGITPAKFAERLRVEAARRQLEQTVKAVKEIAASCGFSSSEIIEYALKNQLSDGAQSSARNGSHRRPGKSLPAEPCG